MLQRARYGGPVAGRPVHAEHDALAELGRQHRAAAVPAPGVHGHDPLHRPGLLQQAVDDMRQPGGTVVSDDDRRYDMLRVRFTAQLGTALLLK